jgi:uridine kinase
MSQPNVTLSEPRTNVRVTFPDGMVLEAPVGTTIEQFVKAHAELRPTAYTSLYIAAIFDSKLRELAHPVKRDATLEPVLLPDSDGGRIYRRSLVLLLVTAIEELWPGTNVNVSYAVPDGGFYCMLPNREPFSEEELAQLEAHMHKIVAEDNPITKRQVKLEEVVSMFTERGDDDKVRLLEQRTRNGLVLYTLRNRSDYYYGYMVPSTGYLKVFRLVKMPRGFILQYPTRDEPNTLADIIPNTTKIGAVFEQAEDWLQRLGVEDFGRLNQIVRQDRIQELILVSEALHEQQIARIASTIYEGHHEHGLRLVLIAGPSSSGKTTFSKRLAIQLLAHGLRPFTLELDNYFVDRDLTPKDEEGNLDFEAIEAINLPLFNTHLLQLIQGEEVQLPKFDFLLGKSVQGAVGKLTENQILIVEGIHGMNPALVTKIPAEKIYRIYVSALTQLNVDAHNRVSTTDVRMLRRICRDAVQRGHNATDTITRWPSVRRGEKRNIFPYQENADVMFNSALTYELAALRPLVEPLLLQVEPGTKPYIEANRLLSFLRWVQPLTPAQTALIPDTSLLREFIGASILQDYQPGDLQTKDV